MAKIKITGVKDVSKKLKRNLRIETNKIFRNPLIRKEVGRIVVEDIKKNVDFGSPSKGTLRWRKTYDGINNTDPAYRRNKLNAVFSGELLKDLQDSVRGFPTELTFDISHSDKKHRKYQGVTKKIGKNTPYKIISEYLVEDLGYDYFQLSEDAERKIINLIREELFKLLSNV